MRKILPLLLTVLISGACGGETETQTEVGTSGMRETVSGSQRQVLSCTPLDAELVSSSTTAADVPFEFEHPRGWNVDAMAAAGEVTVDMSTRLGSDEGPSDLVLRLQASQDAMPKWQNQLDVWRQMPGVEVEETTAGDETIYIARTSDDKTQLTQALLTSGDRAHRINAAVVRVPRGCESRAGELLREILRGITIS